MFLSVFKGLKIIQNWTYDFKITYVIVRIVLGLPILKNAKV